MPRLPCATERKVKLISTCPLAGILFVVTVMQHPFARQKLEILTLVSLPENNGLSLHGRWPGHAPWARPVFLTHCRDIRPDTDPDASHSGHCPDTLQDTLNTREALRTHRPDTLQDTPDTRGAVLLDTLPCIVSDRTQGTPDTRGAGSLDTSYYNNNSGHSLITPAAALRRP